MSTPIGAPVRAWIWLVALSGTTTGIALSPLSGPIAGVLILACAWAKARLILLDYLRLRGVAGWQGGLELGLALFGALLFALFLAGGSVTP